MCGVVDHERDRGQSALVAEQPVDPAAVYGRVAEHGVVGHVLGDLPQCLAQRVGEDAVEARHPERAAGEGRHPQRLRGQPHRLRGGPAHQVGGVEVECVEVDHDQGRGRVVEAGGRGGEASGESVSLDVGEEVVHP